MTCRNPNPGNQQSLPAHFFARTLGGGDDQTLLLHAPVAPAAPSLKDPGADADISNSISPAILFPNPQSLVCMNPVLSRKEVGFLCP